MSQQELRRSFKSVTSILDRIFERARQRCSHDCASIVTDMEADTAFMWKTPSTSIAQRSVVPDIFLERVGTEASNNAADFLDTVKSKTGPEFGFESGARYQYSDKAERSMAQKSCPENGRKFWRERPKDTCGLCVPILWQIRHRTSVCKKATRTTKRVARSHSSPSQVVAKRAPRSHAHALQHTSITDVAS